MKSFILMCLLLTSCGRGIEFSDGLRVGNIIQFSKTGLICKSFEGRLALTTNSGMSSETWDFSVDKEELVEVLQKAQETGAKVRISYKQGVLSGPCISETAYFVDDVKLLNEQAERGE